MNNNLLVRNWVENSTRSVLNEIHHSEVNISIYNRDVSQLSAEIDLLLNLEVDFKSSGGLKSIMNDLRAVLDASLFGRLIEDVKELLRIFESVSSADSYRLFLGTVNTNMCRKFHTDINDLRMLCTYSGPGTLWLKEENINREALGLPSSDEEDIVLNENDIQQAETGSVVILKGAIYPKSGTRAVVHRSPTIEETGTRRLLLRIDTNEFLNY